MKKKQMIIVTVIFLVGMLITGCDLIGPTTIPTPMPTPVSDSSVIAEANLVPVDEITLSFSIPGKVGAILVEEGERVEAGQVLARLDDIKLLEAQVLSAESAVLLAELQLDGLNENADLLAARAQQNLVEEQQNLVEAERAWESVDQDDFLEALDDARIDLVDAEDALEDAQEVLADYENLDQDNLTRKTAQEDVEQAQQDYDEARWAFEDLQNRYDLAMAQLETAQAVLADAEHRVDAAANGPDPDDLALANASLDQAVAQLEAAQQALEDAELRAPFAGTIVHVDMTEGAHTSLGQAAVVLADMSKWVLETNDLTEVEVIQIEEGDGVTITFDALPDIAFNGEVNAISDYFIERFGDITYHVRISLEDPDVRLRWGMTAEVAFSDK